MSKTKVFFLLVIAVLLSWLFMIFPGRLLEATISTWPVLNKWKILSPQAPIVITNRETVRVSDTGDAAQAAQQVKSKISMVVSELNGGQTVVGGAINLTSDGAFVGSAAEFSAKPGADYYVVLNDGTAAKINQRITDLATGLEFFTASLNNVPVASLGNSSDLSSGDKIAFVQSSPTVFAIKSQIAYVFSTQNDIADENLESDYPSRSFTASSSGAMLPGSAIVNTNSEIVGVWNGNQIISSDVINKAQSLYLSNPSAIVRPSFGFAYTLSSAGSLVTENLPQGYKILSVASGGAAQKAGLEAGDMVTSVGGQSLNTTSMEQALENYKPGDVVTFAFTRGQNNLNLPLTVGELK